MRSQAGQETVGRSFYCKNQRSTVSISCLPLLPSASCLILCSLFFPARIAYSTPF